MVFEGVKRGQSDLVPHAMQLPADMVGGDIPPIIEWPGNAVIEL